MFSEFVFKLLNRIGPVDRFGHLVVIGDVFVERAFKGAGAGKVIGLQVFALKQTEPDFDLVQPRGIGRQAEHLEVELSVTGHFLLTQPAFELFRGMGGAIVQNQGHDLDLPTQRLGNDLLLHKGLEIDKAFALPTGAVDLAIGDRESGKQMTCAATLIARLVQHRHAGACWTGRLLTLAGLNGGFLIETDQPGACS